MPRWKWKLPVARGFLAESWPLLISSVMIMIYMRTDQVMLGKLASAVVVGQYTSVAVRLSEIWYGIPIVICVSVMPRLLKSMEADPARYYARLERLYEGMILLGILVGLTTQLAGPLVVRILFGRQFAPAASILSVHIWTGISLSVGDYERAAELFRRGSPRAAMYRTVAGAIVNVALNFLWIPRWGGLGSAIATLTAYSVASYFADVIHPSTRHIFRMKTRACLHFWMPLQIVFQEIAGRSMEVSR